MEVTTMDGSIWSDTTTWPGELYLNITTTSKARISSHYAVLWKGVLGHVTM